MNEGGGIMKKGLMLMSGAGIGAALMYMLDPDRGKRRRAIVRDKARHLATEANQAIGKTSRDLNNRITGLFADAQSLFACDEAPDQVIVARVRTKLGRVVSHPGLISVSAADGRVTLSGFVREEERGRAVEGAMSVRGVEDVEDLLEPVEEPEAAPESQEKNARHGPTPALLQASWSPTLRLLVGAAGGAVVLYAAKRRGIIGAAVAPVGIGMLSRSLTNLDIKRLVGVGAGTRAVDIEKTINIAAPVEQVFEFWAHHEKFPQFMSNVKEVRPVGEQQYHWVVAGPAGISVEWDAEITRLVPNQLIEWKSLPGSAIGQSGRVRFLRISENKTRVDVKMSYNPPAGAIGHLIALLLGSDPKSEMDDDLLRMKSFIETGHVPHDAAAKRAHKASA
jgi:uncharacterized membrane protein